MAPVLFGHRVNYLYEFDILLLDQVTAYNVGEPCEYIYSAGTAADLTLMVVDGC